MDAVEQIVPAERLGYVSNGPGTKRAVPPTRRECHFGRPRLGQRSAKAEL